MIIYLNDMLIMATSLEEILMSRDTVIFLLQHLGFLINLQKSKLEPNTKLEFLVVEINSVDVATYLSEEKITDITNLCKKLLLQEENTTLRELTSLIGKLISTYQAVLPTTLHCCSSQMYQITKLRANLCYEDKINLNAASLEELKWWCHNLNLNKGRPTKIQNAKIIIQLDAAKLGGWGAHCQGLTTGSQWSKTEAQTPHKCFRNESSQIVNRVVLQGEKKTKSVHLQIDNVTWRKWEEQRAQNSTKFRRKIGSTKLGTRSNLLQNTSQALKTVRQIGNHAIPSTRVSGNCVSRYFLHHACHSNSLGTCHGNWTLVVGQWVPCNKNKHICCPMIFTHFL